jgi:hypothetical protein
MSGIPSISDLTRLGSAIFRPLRDRVARPARPVPESVIEAGERTPCADGENGLAAFYAWQMAVSRIEPVH